MKPVSYGGLPLGEAGASSHLLQNQEARWGKTVAFNHPEELGRDHLSLCALSRQAK